MISLFGFHLVKATQHHYDIHGDIAANAAFLADNNNLCWYEAQKLFKPSTYKIVYDNDGRICAFSKDASTLFPINKNVVELNVIPKDFDISSYWYYGPNGIYFNESAKAAKIAERRNALKAKAELLREFL